MSPDNSQDRKELIRTAFFREIGEKIAFDRPDDFDILVSICSMNFLDAVGEGSICELPPEGYEHIRQQFISFNRDKVPIEDPVSLKHLREPEVFDGFVGGLVKRGFLQIETDSESQISTWELTEQGEEEVALINAQYDIDVLSDKKDKTEEEVTGSRRAYIEAAEARFEFWEKRVSEEGISLTDDEKARIINPTHEYGYAGLFPPSYYEAKRREQMEALTAGGRDELSDEEKLVVRKVEESLPALESMQQDGNFKLPILRQDPQNEQ